MYALQVTQLGKAFRHYASRRDRLLEWLGRGPRHQLTWVLRDLHFSVDPGEALGIIGVNGAGKSTLLKLIAGTAHATTGQIQVQGRVAALLELGLGFHDQFSGRHNAWTAAQLGGLDAATIAREMDGIIDFADIGAYFDQPVRTYSSGMKVRLAFAVATAVRPDILIIDEALAVGDVFFQQKCFERIRAYRDAGTTLLFVSHSMSAVYSLCERAILLHAGRIRHDGPPREVIDLYNAEVAHRLSASALQITEAAGAQQAGQPSGQPSNQRPGSYDTGSASIDSVQILDGERPVQTLVSNQALRLRIQARFHQAFDDPHIGFQVRDRRGEILYRTHTHGQHLRIGPVAAGDRRCVDFAFHADLAPGDYSITVGVAEGGDLEGRVRHSLTRRQDAAHFSIARNLDAPYWDGVCDLKPRCRIHPPGTECESDD
ncbi:MAG: ABC transporter ATP-binding protein [Halomonas sp.]